MSELSNISITPEACRHIRSQLQLTQAQYLRLAVKESGCNGYMYMLDFLETPASDDECLDFGDGVRVCINQADLPMVAGTEVDMITEGLNSALVFKNPNATSYCGCGESFAVAAEIGADADTDAPSSSDLEKLATDVGKN